MSDEPRRYSDREVALIIQAALDIEQQEQRDGKGGLLLSEIQDIARETGISVEHVRRAVEGIVEGRKRSRAGLLLGGETSFTCLNVLPQALTQEELEALNQSLPGLTNLSQSSLVKGETLAWSRSVLKSLLDGFPLKLSVRQGGEGTEIEAKARLGSMAALLFAGSSGIGALAGIKVALLAMLLAGIGSFSLPVSALVISAGAIVGAGGFWLLARLAFRAFVRRSREKVATIVDRIKASILAMRK